MSKTLIVNNIPFEYPEQGEQQPWGEAATGWASEVTNVLSSLKSSSDILETSANIQNNVTTPTAVNQLVFNSTTVRSFQVQASIYRTVGALQKSEEIHLVGLNKGTAGWDLQQDGIGDSGVSLTIDSNGQVYYTSSNLGTPHTGVIVFKAETISIV